MLTKPFSPARVAVPTIGQGTWQIEGTGHAAAVAALRLGLDLGMTHIDTAEMYGSGAAERIVGEAIAGRRNEVFLVSKVLPGNASATGTRAAHVRDNAAAGDLKLSAAEIAALAAAFPLGRRSGQLPTI